MKFRSKMVFLLPFRKRLVLGFRRLVLGKHIPHEKPWQMHFLARHSQKGSKNKFFERNITEYRQAPWQITHIGHRRAGSSTTHWSVFSRNIYRYSNTKLINLYLMYILVPCKCMLWFVYYFVSKMRNDTKCTGIVFGNYFLECGMGFSHNWCHSVTSFVECEKDTGPLKIAFIHCGMENDQVKQWL